MLQYNKCNINAVNIYLIFVNNVYSHNINAAAVSGFDFSQMNARTAYTDIFHTNSNETNLGTPVFTNSSSLSKL